MVLASALAAALASPSVAAPGSGPSPTEIPASNDEIRDDAERVTPRQQAERDYGDAYREVTKARADLAKGSTKQAQKRLRKALDRATSAVTLDSTYFEAWNLVGFTNRQLGDYDRSLAAYGRCLRINPEYAPAHEYLGEAYVDLGKADKAREQLEWLVKFGSPDMIDGLQAKIRVLENTPRSAAATGASGAQPDSVRSGEASH